MQTCGYSQKPKILGSNPQNSSAAHVFACMDSLIRLCAQTPAGSTRSVSHPKTSNTAGVWHPSGDTFYPSTLAARGLTFCSKEIYKKLAAQSLVLPGSASVFPQGTEEWIGMLCTRMSVYVFTGKAGSVSVCLGLPIQSQASADLISLSLNNKTFFTAPIKANITHTYPHTLIGLIVQRQSNEVKHPSSPSLRGTALTLIH